ncbi:MAG: hypothetical protein ABIO57_02605 [Candidatus Paceibacterota bacterium]
MEKGEQHQLFPVDEVRELKTKGSWGVEFFTSDYLQFELVPIIALLGHEYINGVKNNPSLIRYIERHKEFKKIKKGAITPTLLSSFGFKKDNELLLKYVNEIQQYAAHEAPKTKRQSHLKRFAKNMFTEKDLISMWGYGSICLEYQDNIPSEYLQHIKRSLGDASPHVPNFSHAARYILNGLSDRYWYEETHRDVMKLFPGEDPRVIFDLLAATSVRSSIEANAKKFALARYQYYKKEYREVTIRIGKNPKIVQSIFQGFLSATLVHLIDIGDGLHLCEASEDLGVKINARKIKNFSKAMMGSVDAVPVDIWLMRVFDTDIKALYQGRMLSRSPTPKLYNALHAYFKIVARATGFEARQVSASAWAGIRGEHSNSKTTRFKPLLEKTLNKGIFASVA